MANSDFGVRFTDLTYATRQDVAKTLNTQLIDNIWKSIIEYRSKFCAIISLRNISKTPFRITYTPVIVSKINAVERKLSSAMVNYSNFAGNNREKYALKHKIYSDILKAVALKNNIQLSESTINSIINGENIEYSLLEMPIYRYFTALKDFETHFADPINDTFFARMYSLLVDNNNLTLLYREKDFDNSARLFLNHDYSNGAPSYLLESMIANLQDFVVNSEQPFLVKAIAGFFFINLVQPFEEFNKEMAVLIMKSIVSHANINEVSALFPFEDLIANDQEELKRIILESQKTNDFTYILVYCLDKISLASDSLLDNIENYRIYSAKNEFRQDGEIEASEVSSKEKVIEDNEIKEEAAPIEQEVSPKSIIEPQEEKPVEPKQPQIKKENKVFTEEKVTSEATLNKLAVPKEVFQLSENDAQKYEEYLLETEVSMKRGQAHFYARHCTIGKYYTIQQYKRSIGVVYETARTSMENLVKLGYYKKEQIKNKFVYTPVEKK